MKPAASALGAVAGSGGAPLCRCCLPPPPPGRTAARLGVQPRLVHSGFTSRATAAAAECWQPQQQRQQQQQRQPWRSSRRPCRPPGAAAAAAPAAPSGASSSGASSSDAAPAAPPAAASQGGGLQAADLWALLRPDWPQLLACVLCTAVSVSTAVTVAPALGAVVDIISRGTAATTSELAAAVGRLGGVYIISNITLAAQVGGWGRAGWLALEGKALGGLQLAAGMAQHIHVTRRYERARCRGSGCSKRVPLCLPTPARSARMLCLQVALALALGEALAHRLRCRLFGALVRRDTLFYDRVKTGQLVAWLGQDIEVLQVRLRVTQEGWDCVWGGRGGGGGGGARGVFWVKKAPGMCCRETQAALLQPGVHPYTISGKPIFVTLPLPPTPTNRRAPCPSCWAHAASAPPLRQWASSL